MIDFAAARRMMVDGQVRTADVTDPRLLAAMLELPRERFFPDDKASLAYLDLDVAGQRAGAAGPPPAQADGAGQADPGRRHRRDRSRARCRLRHRLFDGAAGASRRFGGRPRGGRGLARQAAEAMSWAGLPNVKIVTGPLARGCAGEGPYDVIVLQGAAEVVPAALFDQLKERRPAGLRARPRARAARRCFIAASMAISAAVRCSMPPRRRCRALPSRRTSFSSARVPRSIAAARIARAGAQPYIFLCMTDRLGVSKPSTRLRKLASGPSHDRVALRAVRVWPCEVRGRACVRVLDNAGPSRWAWRARDRRSVAAIAGACRRRRFGRHAEVGADPGLPEQSAAQRPARRGARHRRNRAAGAVGLSPARQPHRHSPASSIWTSHHQDHRCDRCRHATTRLRRQRRRAELRRHRHADAVQRLPDRQPHPAGRAAGVRRARDAAADRAERAAQRRHRLHEPAARRRDPRSAAQQRRGAAGAAAPDPRPLQCRRGDAHRRGAVGIAARRRRAPRC